MVGLNLDIMNLGILSVGYVGSDTLIWLRLVKEDLLTFMSDFEGCQPVR